MSFDVELELDRKARLEELTCPNASVEEEEEAFGCRWVLDVAADLVALVALAAGRAFGREGRGGVRGGIAALALSLECEADVVGVEAWFVKGERGAKSFVRLVDQRRR